MYPLDYTNDSLTSLIQNIITTSSTYNLSNVSKRHNKRQKITTIYASDLSLSNLTSTPSVGFQKQLSTFEDPYSVTTGIKTAGLLGGVLIAVVLYLLWKSRTRLCHSPSLPNTDINNAHLSGAQFDLDYWLKQVDLLEAKEIQRNRNGPLPSFELPTEEPRDRRKATASWIVDVYHQWQLNQHRQQCQILQQTNNPPKESNLLPYRPRRHLLRRLVRRLLVQSRNHPLHLDQHLSVLMADSSPSRAHHYFALPSETLDIPLRRVASWPRVKPTRNQNCSTMSSSQTRNVRKRLLQQTSRTNNKLDK